MKPPTKPTRKILFLGTEADKPYLSFLKKHIQTYSLQRFDMLSELVSVFGATGTTHIATTQDWLIPVLCPSASSSKQTLNDYSGSLVEHSSGITFMFIDPLAHCVTKSYGKFMLDRYMSKFTTPSKWITTDSFGFTILESPDQYEDALHYLKHSILCAVDIETRPDLSISSISYTGIQQVGKHIQSTSFVVPLPYGLSQQEYQWRFSWTTRFNATTIPKVLQNGKYDAAYKQRYNVPLYEYYYDTQLMHHSWLAELPQALETIAPFYIRKTVFWKNEGNTGNLYDLYRYNALDSWHTAWVALAWLAEAPKWAKRNYLLSWQTLAPNFLCESTGLAVNYPQFYKVKAVQEKKWARALLGLQYSTGEMLYNPGSSDQNKRLLKVLGMADVRSADKKVLARAAHVHPFIGLLVHKILDYSRAQKMLGTYLNEDKHFQGRFLFSLSATTDTSRSKSRGHAFWCGANAQTFPRDDNIRTYIEADEGFLFGEADYAQAESRDTGYITGDTVLIANVESDLDFHKSNASMFFGVPYDEVSPTLRQLAKPVNHGANYLMAEDTLIDSMGLSNVYMAAKLLRLPKMWMPKKICKHLLACFAAVYKIVSHDYPRWIKATVKESQKLVNPYGWTRWCFGDPTKNSADLRSYVAHLPQSTNAQALSKAGWLIFTNVWQSNSDNFKMCLFAHDSLLFQYRIGHEYLGEQVAYWMEVAAAVEVKDIKGVKRLMKIPVDIKMGSKSWKVEK